MRAAGPTSSIFGYSPRGGAFPPVMVHVCPRKRLAHAVLNGPDAPAVRQNLPDVYGIVARLPLAVLIMPDAYDPSIHPLGVLLAMAGTVS
jgi:hypothetical protein